jgi:hypothetical protein
LDRHAGHIFVKTLRTGSTLRRDPNITW